MAAIRSLRWKLVASYLLLVVVALVAIYVMTRSTVRSVFVSYQQSTLIRQGQPLALALGADYAQTHDWAQEARQFGPRALFVRNEFWVVNAQGAPVLVQPPSAPQADRPTLAQLRPALHGDVTAGENGTLFSEPRGIWVALPIRADNAVVGAVYLQTSPEFVPYGRDGASRVLAEATQSFLASVERRVALAGVAVGCFAVLLGILLARSITDPIQELRRAVGRIAAGDLSQRVGVRTGDEVGALAADVNVMATRLEAYVAELRRQEALRRDLVANVSHDLATPLTGIQGFTEALIDNVVTGEEERADLYGSIYREVQRLRRLVGDLQDLSALENGLGHFQPQPLRLQELAEEALKVVAGEAQERGIALDQRVPDDLPAVLADGDRIAQVLLNLVDNAMRFTPAGGSITVSARRLGERAEVTVADTGSGIPPEELPQVFERFYRVDRSRSRETGGGGLGLAIVKAIVTAHGGEVGASSALGRGTEMRFTLPLAPVQAALRSAAPRAAAPAAVE